MDASILDQQRHLLAAISFLKRGAPEQTLALLYSFPTTSFRVEEDEKKDPPFEYFWEDALTLCRPDDGRSETLGKFAWLCQLAPMFLKFQELDPSATDTDTFTGYVEKWEAANRDEVQKFGLGAASLLEPRDNARVALEELAIHLNTTVLARAATASEFERSVQPTVEHVKNTLEWLRATQARVDAEDRKDSFYAWFGETKLAGLLVDLDTYVTGLKKTKKVAEEVANTQRPLDASYRLALGPRPPKTKTRYKKRDNALAEENYTPLEKYTWWVTLYWQQLKRLFVGIQATLRAERERRQKKLSTLVNVTLAVRTQEIYKEAQEALETLEKGQKQDDDDDEDDNFDFNQNAPLPFLILLNATLALLTKAVRPDTRPWFQVLRDAAFGWQLLKGHVENQLTDIGMPDLDSPVVSPAVKRETNASSRQQRGKGSMKNTILDRWKQLSAAEPQRLDDSWPASLRNDSINRDFVRWSTELFDNFRELVGARRVLSDISYGRGGVYGDTGGSVVLDLTRSSPPKKRRRRQAETTEAVVDLTEESVPLARPRRRPRVPGPSEPTTEKTPEWRGLSKTGLFEVSGKQLTRHGLYDTSLHKTMQGHTLTPDQSLQVDTRARAYTTFVIVLSGSSHGHWERPAGRYTTKPISLLAPGTRLPLPTAIATILWSLEQEEQKQGYNEARWDNPLILAELFHPSVQSGIVTALKSLQSRLLNLVNHEDLFASPDGYLSIFNRTEFVSNLMQLLHTYPLIQITLTDWAGMVEATMVEQGFERAEAPRFQDKNERGVVRRLNVHADNVIRAVLNFGIKNTYTRLVAPRRGPLSAQNFLTMIGSSRIGLDATAQSVQWIQKMFSQK